MGNSIKTGGVGKSPAIEKISRLNELGSRMEAAAALEKQAFEDQQGSAHRAVQRRRQIVEEFQIHFGKTKACRQ